MKTVPSKQTQQKMFDFFMRTSAPRLVKKAQEVEERQSDHQKEGQLNGNNC